MKHNTNIDYSKDDVEVVSVPKSYIENDNTPSWVTPVVNYGITTGGLLVPNKVRDDGVQEVSQVDSKAKNAETVSPVDEEDLDSITQGLYIGVSGDVTVTLENMTDDTNITLKDLAAGVIHPLKIKRVWETGTTATDIIALY